MYGNFINEVKSVHHESNILKLMMLIKEESGNSTYQTFFRDQFLFTRVCVEKKIGHNN